MKSRREFKVAIKCQNEHSLNGYCNVTPTQKNCGRDNQPEVLGLLTNQETTIQDLCNSRNLVAFYKFRILSSSELLQNYNSTQNCS